MKNVSTSTLLLDKLGAEIEPGQKAEVAGAVGIVVSTRCKRFERYPVAIFFGTGSPPTEEEYLADTKKFETTVSCFYPHVVKIQPK